MSLKRLNIIIMKITILPSQRWKIIVIENPCFTITFTDHNRSTKSKWGLFSLAGSPKGNFVKLIFTQGVVGSVQTRKGVDVIREFFDAVDLFPEVIGFQEVLKLLKNENVQICE